VTLAARATGSNALSHFPQTPVDGKSFPCVATGLGSHSAVRLYFSFAAAALSFSRSFPIFLITPSA
jgi:hypothetical protein